MADQVLTAILVFVLPSYMLWRSLAARGKPPERRVARYVRTIVIALALISLLALDGSASSSRLSSLGLAAPVSGPAVIGLGVAVVLLTTLAIVMIARGSAPKGGDPDNVRQEIMPQTRDEAIVFVVFCLVVGCAWEVLYRGYLLFTLPPHIGWAAAIILAAGAYSVAHGFRNAKMFLGSLASALVFTIAFALTRSLWWLMLVHCGLPLLGAFASRRRRIDTPGDAIQPAAS